MPHRVIDQIQSRTFEQWGVLRGFRIFVQQLMSGTPGLESQLGKFFVTALKSQFPPL